MFDDSVDLIDVLAVRPAPVAPLGTVNAAEITAFVGPFVPNRHAMFLQISDVRVSV